MITISLLSVEKIPIFQQLYDLAPLILSNIVVAFFKSNLT